MIPQNLPPRIAIWLLSLFATGEEVESILGDLLEEFSHMASKAGVAAARRWYWRQAMKTVAHLIGIGFRAARWAIAAAVAGGILLTRLVSGLPERAILAVLERYSVFDHHFSVYVFFATYGIAIGHVIASLFVGCMVALVARNNEMAATIALVLAFFTMTVVAVPVWIATGHTPILSILAWNFAAWLGIMIGGVIVRMRRSASPSHA
jgi:hypothetical protein